jgi:hypothetical protein
MLVYQRVLSLKILTIQARHVSIQAPGQDLCIEVAGPEPLPASMDSKKPMVF